MRVLHFMTAFGTIIKALVEDVNSTGNLINFKK